MGQTVSRANDASQFGAFWLTLPKAICKGHILSSGMEERNRVHCVSAPVAFGTD